MIPRRIGVVAFATMLLAVMPTASFNLRSFEVGKPATGVTQTTGRPLVIVAFASWCVGCIDELPQVLADYNRFKDRVDFLGVDYLDNPAAGQALIEKEHIPFPVVESQPSTGAPPPADPNEPVPGDSFHITGLTPQVLPQVLATLEGRVPASLLVTLKKVAAYCNVHPGAQCIAYGSAHNVELSNPPLHATPQPRADAAQGSDYVDLPHLFVIDSEGIVRANVGGYNSGTNAIAAQLAKLGIK